VACVSVRLKFTSGGADDEIADSVVIGQNWKDDVRVILFVQMAQGFELTENLNRK